ncbi:substrate-binding domain-containing protein [Variovorax sp. VRV01]|uniref:substrate-binding domain-containing protein n=1 Tax=Variovorax sp. VRV01 TaxID=2769259 RepID=UPI00177CEECB|nr:substrate-binding domain-containing protein [Variovorax sp. VRV01]MBD9664160.1 substrate-binding domain-containing protein [Variovorax sp. VRV01]
MKPQTFSFNRLTRRASLLAAASVLAACGSFGSAPPAAGDIHVMTSGGFTAAYNELRPGFERSSGRTVKTAYGASMGNAEDSIPSRLSRNEPADVVILARPALDSLVAQGKVVPGSQVDLVRSSIGFAVRKGAPKPDISTVDALKRTLLAAPSIAYSASASGTYYETELLKKLGIEERVLPKSKRILSERVGTVVARGDAALGLQQVSELLPIAGIDYIGPLPAEVQQVTVFSAGIATASKQPDAARQLIRYLNSPEAAPTIAKTGLEPLTARR